jgi:anthranilate phosphoribosyltransferase
MNQLLNDLFHDRTLSRTEAAGLMRDITRGEGTDAQLAALMTVFSMRCITPEELSGFRDTLLELAIPVQLDASDAIDLCGTGGDGKNTFNISTLTAFVVAGAGGRVAKHGNYGVSSISGSSDVLERLGIRFTADSDQLKRQFGQTGLCFLHAPLFHPALKRVGAIRRQLGFPTFFNLLGPLVNPAQPAGQVMGVSSRQHARICHYLAQQKNGRYMILHSEDGYDEISLTSPVYIHSNNGDAILEPEELELVRCRPADLYGGATPDEAAQCLLTILSGKGTSAQENVVVANAAVALHCNGRVNNLRDGCDRAREAIRSGAAYRVLQQLQQLSNR